MIPDLLVQQTLIRTNGLSAEAANRTVMAECVAQGASPEAAARMLNLSAAEGSELWSSIVAEVGESIDD